MEGGGLIYLPSGKLEAEKSCSNLSKASLMWEWEHSRRASWPKLLLEFLVVQTQNRGGRPEHSFPGVREIEDTPKGFHFLSIL